MKNQNAISLIALFLFLSPVALLAQTAQDYQDLGNAVYQKGLYAKAMDYYKQAVQANPNDWQSYEDMGDSYMKMNDNSDALAAYQKSLQINPNNSAVQTQVNSLQSSGTTPAQAQDNSGMAPQPSNNSQWEESQPTTVVVERRRHPWRRPEVMVDYKDGLAPINHARYWIDADLAYNWSNQADFFNGASSVNSFIQQNNLTGIATADHSGLEAGVELGFLLNPYNGIAIGIHGIQSNNYTSNINYQNGNPSDFETITLTPYVIPLTLDYYLFLPDHEGRFFLTAGVGYYFVDVNGDDNFSSANAGGNTDEYYGDMYGGNIGFQLGIGREFEIGPRLGLRLFARGRYCKITNINGNFTSANGISDNYGLVVLPNNGGVGIDSTSNIGGNEHYATLDYTGFEFGVGLTFF